ncbi:MAG TPA: spherulation-specific family 4 protein [Polyangium sp.]|nr:spherulation-specific family 4 protein [Polyangium sp.]
MNTSISSIRFALLNRALAACTLVAAFGLGGCVADGTVEMDDSAVLDDNEGIAEGSSALTDAELANGFWLNGIWGLKANIGEKGFYLKDSVDGGNGKACWTHEKYTYSFGYVTGSGWTLFNGMYCDMGAKIAAVAAQNQLGVHPCQDGVSFITCTRPKVGSLVPLYSYPTEYNASGQKVTSTAWSRILSAKQANPTVPIQVIINPCNGPDVTKCGMSSANITDYNNEITKLTNAGVIVLGYIATNYAENNASHPDIETEIKAAIDKYYASYPGVKGVFFDEMTNGYESNLGYITTRHMNFYARIRDYARTKSSSTTAVREYVVVGNPGSEVAPDYPYLADTLVTYENSQLPAGDALNGIGNWRALWDRTNFAVLSYGQAAVDQSFLNAARPNTGFVYLTNDTLPNPWDTVPTYFSTLVGGLN